MNASLPVEVESVLLAAHDPYPHIPAGQYEVECVSVKVQFDYQYHRWEAILKLRTAPYEKEPGTMLFCFMNLGDAGEARTVGRRSKFWRCWVVANRGVQPLRRQAMNPKIFEGKLFRVNVIDVKEDYRQRPQVALYSVVEELLELLP